jgi:thiol-disulfide isomerase/thioredoxin
MLIPALLSCVVLGDVLVPGMAAPAFTADASIKGAEVKALAPGKVHVVEFWATWCGPCIGSMPHLTQLQKSNPDVTVIGVAGFERGNDVTAKEKKVRDFIAAKPERADYTIVFDGDGTMANEWMQAARRNSIPTAFVVGMDGKIAYIGSPDANLDAAVAKAKGAAAAPRTANQPMVAGPADDSGNGKGAAPAKAVTVTSPERTVEVTEEPTDETGTSTSTSITTESKSTTVNGVATTESTTVETVVEVKDGKRRTTVTRTTTRSEGAKPVSGGASSATSTGASSSASSKASSSGSSSSSSGGSSGGSSGSSAGSGNTPR